ncbi:hypothetical protein SUGI_0990060 [Cryptomeria japonica]|nr:hypothetical protein SUGI_0990060 [Cryptomeria japonica]
MSCIVQGTSLSVLKRRYSNIPLVNTSEARLGVFWDLQSCGVPEGLSVRDVALNITKFLRKGGHNEPITTFRAYEDAASTVILNLQEQWNRFSVIDGDNSVEVSVVKPPWIVQETRLCYSAWPSHCQSGKNPNPAFSWRTIEVPLFLAYIFGAHRGALSTILTFSTGLAAGF